MSSDMQGVYCSLSLSKGDFDTSVKSGVLIIPAMVHIAPIVIAAFVLRAVALNCSGLQMALYRSYAMNVNVSTLTDTLTP